MTHCVKEIFLEFRCAYKKRVHQQTQQEQNYIIT